MHRRYNVVGAALGGIVGQPGASGRGGLRGSVRCVGGQPGQSQATADIHAAKQARNRLLVELVGDADSVPVEVAERVGLTGREAAHILDTAWSGSQQMRDHVFGEPEGTSPDAGPSNLV